MLSRRDFLKTTALGTVAALFWKGGTLYARSRGSRTATVVAAIPGGTLDPKDIPKYLTPLLIPPVMPKAAKLVQRGGKNADYYEISLRQFQQQILPKGMPTTTVWGYGPTRSASKKGLLLHYAPSLTIEADWKAPVRIKWINDLKDPNGSYLPHLLTVDPTLHWANPPGGAMHRDTRPSFAATPGPYTGPVPMVTHVHGAAPVGDESDGYAEAWYLPDAANIPDGYASTGTWYDYFGGKAAARGYVAPGAAAWEPGTAVFQYSNDQRATTLWYHDHTLGMTRLNVYAGPAGFYIIRGGPAGDDAVRDARSNRAAVLPGPAPREGDAFPPNKTYCEIPIVIQDRSFNADGSLFYPDSRAFFDEIAGPYIPDSDISPMWNPEFFGNCMMINGSTWPYLDVQQRRYRFRFLNGCNSRFLILDFSGIPGVEVWQIGGDGGFLAAPVNMMSAAGGRLLMGPAERADVIVDFTNVPLGSHILANVGPDEPFGGGLPDEDFDTADPHSTGQVLRFNVGRIAGKDATTPPQHLVLPGVPPVAGGTVRTLALLEQMSANFDDSPAEALLGTVAFDPQTGVGTPAQQLWMAPVTENPGVAAAETWEIYNTTADAHPIHLHEVSFQIVNRQDIIIAEGGREEEGDEGAGEGGVKVRLSTDPPRPPEPWETGFKDTVIAYPGQVTRVRAEFKTAGQYVWHCHILEHEDNEMMRPYRIGPADPNAPGHVMSAGALQSDPAAETAAP